MDYTFTISRPMFADGLSLWLVVWSETRYLTVCVILTLIETPSNVYLRHTCVKSVQL